MLNVILILFTDTQMFSESVNPELDHKVKKGLYFLLKWGLHSLIRWHNRNN